MKSKTEEEKKEIEEELKNILIDLKKEAISKFKNESDIKRFLDNIINFNNYSFNNMMLIYAQKPDINYVSSFKKIRDMGYKVNKDAKGIKVFIPNFLTFVKEQVTEYQIDIKPLFMLDKEEKIRYHDKNDNSITLFKQKLTGFSLGNVFDIRDTNMPIEVINNELNPNLYDPRADSLTDVFIKAIYMDGFKVEYQDLKDNVKGYCDHENKKIVLKKNLGNLMQMKVLIHEYAHALAHKHLEDNKKDYLEHRNKYETEAESIAYVVSKYLGMDTSGYSLNYLYSWSKNKDFEEIDDSLETIVNYSKKVINNFEKFYEREFGLYADEKINVSL